MRSVVAGTGVRLRTAVGGARFASSGAQSTSVTKLTEEARRSKGRTWVQAGGGGALPAAELPPQPPSLPETTRSYVLSKGRLPPPSRLGGGAQATMGLVEDDGRPAAPDDTERGDVASEEKEKLMRELDALAESADADVADDDGGAPAGEPCYVRLLEDRMVRDRYPIILQHEIVAADHRLPAPDSDSDLVQVRNTAGDRLLGIGLWQRSKADGRTGLVRVVDWLPSAGFGARSPPVGSPLATAPVRLGRKFWFEKFARALDYRQTVVDFDKTDAFRIINGDADGVPGVLVDAFSTIATVRVHDLVARNYLKYIIEFLHTRTPASCTHVSYSTRRLAAYFPQLVGHLPRRPRKNVMFRENGLRFEAAMDLPAGMQFSVERRGLRSLVMQHAAGRHVADVGGRSGANSVYALAGDAARVTLVGECEESLRVAENTVTANFSKAGLSPTEIRSRMNAGLLRGPDGADARFFTVCKKRINFLRQVEDGAYDMIILDPCHPQEFPQPVDRHVLLSYFKAAVGKLRTGVKRGALLFVTVSPGTMSHQGVATLLRVAGETVGRRVRLMQPLSPSPDCAADVSMPYHGFTGWMAHVE
eukprot:TRINITY_DN32146_c0_g1_i1.p1 TRINITY_DN32146_c0_g1~~TRINITY_DN32146_c0_g1_i1.p1  ORF type:complete len:590 (+),score=170.97 TRINITY_DN32146_c0_g1_i1:103-1872(+)